MPVPAVTNDKCDAHKGAVAACKCEGRKVGRERLNHVGTRTYLEYNRRLDLLLHQIDGRPVSL